MFQECSLPQQYRRLRTATFFMLKLQILSKNKTKWTRFAAKKQNKMYPFRGKEKGAHVIQSEHQRLLN